jgi:hypothetical protein
VIIVIYCIKEADLRGVVVLQLHQRIAHVQPQDCRVGAEHGIVRTAVHIGAASYPFDQAETEAYSGNGLVAIVERARTVHIAKTYDWRAVASGVGGE